MKISSVVITPGRWIWFVRGTAARQHRLTYSRIARLFNRLDRLPGAWHYPGHEITWTRQTPAYH